MSFPLSPSRKMKGTVEINRKKTSEFWIVTSGNFSIFNRNEKELLNFWVEATEVSENSDETRSEFGISVEVLFELPDNFDQANFLLPIPYIEVPTLGDMDKYQKFQSIWGEDKNLYYNIYYDEHTDIENARIAVRKIGNEFDVVLEGIFDDSFHEGTENTILRISVNCELDNQHKGFWTE
jgi:hypothetical protein